MMVNNVGTVAWATALVAVAAALEENPLCKVASAEWISSALRPTYLHQQRPSHTRPRRPRASTPNDWLFLMGITHLAFHVAATRSVCTWLPVAGTDNILGRLL